MRKFLGGLMVVLLISVYLVPGASGDPVDSGEGRGAGWSVVVPGVATVDLVAEAVATVPSPCPAPPTPCEDHETNQLLNAEVVGGSTASASVLNSQADAYQDAGASATLQSVMDAAATPTLPTLWNTRGYASVENFSALNGSILADSVESETVTAVQSAGGPVTTITASGARVTNLRLSGPLSVYTLATITGEPNQVLLDAGGVRIVYWETNWNPVTATTTDGLPIRASTLRIIDAATGSDLAIAQAESQAAYTPPSPEPPVANDDSATTDEDTAVAIDVDGNDSDPDGDLDPTSVTVTSGPSNGTVTCDAEGICTYTPNSGFSGTDTFEYQICDSSGTRCDTATVTITVNDAGSPVPQPPVAVDDSATTDTGVAITVDVDANDSDPDGDLDPSSVTITDLPDSGTVTCDATGDCTYTPNPGFSGTDTFDYQICDSSGTRCDTATVTITVNAAPIPPASPVAEDDSATTDEDTAVAIDVDANDSDADGDLDPSSVSITSGPSNGSVSCDGTGVCTYTPDAGFDGTDTFDYQICDSSGTRCDTATVTITVEPAPILPLPPNSPVANDDSATTDVGVAVTVDVDANDSDTDGDLDPASITITAQPSSGTISCDATGDCTYTPNPGFSGTDSFDYQICDSSGTRCDTATVTIAVDPAPIPPASPVAEDDTANTDEDVPVQINVDANDSDADGDLDRSSVTVTSGPSNGTVVCDASGVCTYAPDTGFSGTDSFQYEICDSSGTRCDTATVTITVDPAPILPLPPNSPVANDDSATTDMGDAVVVDVDANDSDADGDLDPASITITAQPSSGTVSCDANGNCTYTPNPGFSGTDTFDYQICDSSGTRCDTATVTITVNAAAPPPPANEPPVARDDSATTDEDTSVDIAVVANDNDPNGNLVPGSAGVTVAPTNGAVVCSGGTCTYTPDAGFSGTDSFEYRVCDADNACDSATVTITVTAAGPPPPPANEPPVARDDSASTQRGQSVTIQVTPNDSDPDGDLEPATVAITDQPDNGAVICDNGSCTYTPNDGFSGTDTFEYRVCDSQNACDTATVTVTVTAPPPPGPGPAPDPGPGPADSPPVAEDDSATTAPGTSVEIEVVENDEDPDGDLDNESVTVTEPPSNGAVVCSKGVCTYTPEQGWHGEDTFTYRVCDSAGACTTAQVHVLVPLGLPNPDVDTPDGGSGGGGNGGGGNGDGGNGDGGGGNGDGGGGNGDGGNGTGGGGPEPQEDEPDAPIRLDRPVLGAPNPALPMTGVDPTFFLAIALNLLMLGASFVLVERFTRSRGPQCPAWHNHSENQGRRGCPYGE